MGTAIAAPILGLLTVVFLLARSYGRQRTPPHLRGRTAFATVLVLLVAVAVSSLLLWEVQRAELRSVARLTAQPITETGPRSEAVLVAPGEAAQLLEGDGVVVYDLNPPELLILATGSIPNARRLFGDDAFFHASAYPAGRIEEDLRQLGHDPARTRVLVYCWGGETSRRVAEHLRTRGIRAYSIAGGIRGWKASGHPVRPDLETYVDATLRRLAQPSVQLDTATADAWVATGGTTPILPLALSWTEDGEGALLGGDDGSARDAPLAGHGERWVLIDPRGGAGGSAQDLDGAESTAALGEDWDLVQRALADRLAVRGSPRVAWVVRDASPIREAAVEALRALRAAVGGTWAAVLGLFGLLILARVVMAGRWLRASLVGEEVSLGPGGALLLALPGVVVLALSSLDPALAGSRALASWPGWGAALLGGVAVAASTRWSSAHRGGWFASRLSSLVHPESGGARPSPGTRLPRLSLATAVIVLALLQSLPVAAYLAVVLGAGPLAELLVGGLALLRLQRAPDRARRLLQLGGLGVGTEPAFTIRTRAPGSPGAVLLGTGDTARRVGVFTGAPLDRGDEPLPEELPRLLETARRAGRILRTARLQLGLDHEGAVCTVERFPPTGDPEDSLRFEIAEAAWGLDSASEPVLSSERFNAMGSRTRLDLWILRARLARDGATRRAVAAFGGRWVATATQPAIVNLGSEWFDHLPRLDARHRPGPAPVSRLSRSLGLSAFVLGFERELDDAITSVGWRVRRLRTAMHPARGESRQELTDAVLSAVADLAGEAAVLVEKAALAERVALAAVEAQFEALAVPPAERIRQLTASTPDPRPHARWSTAELGLAARATASGPIELDELDPRPPPPLDHHPKELRRRLRRLFVVADARRRARLVLLYEYAAVGRALQSLRAVLPIDRPAHDFTPAELRDIAGGARPPALIDPVGCPGLPVAVSLRDLERWEPGSAEGAPAAEPSTAALRGTVVSWRDGVGAAPVQIGASMPPTPGVALVLRQPSVRHARAIAAARIVIAEGGGMLSHAAILCRELGVPAVFSVPHATSALAGHRSVRVTPDGAVIPTSEEGAPSCSAAGEVLPLLALTGSMDPAQVGPKAARLGGMRAAGVVAPPGVVVAVPASDRLRAPDGETAARATSRGIIETLPAGKRGWIVRSSAPTEDGVEASFAGILESHGDLRDAEALSQALLAVARSPDSATARSYAEAIGAPAPTSVALLVQPHIDASWGGVLFTDAGDGSMAVELGVGGAEGVVDGAAQSVSLQVDRTDGRVLGSPVLPAGADVVVAPLHAVALKLEGLFGGPQDIEWLSDSAGRITILQSRPITRELPRRVDGGPP